MYPNPAAGLFMLHIEIMFYKVVMRNLNILHKFIAFVERLPLHTLSLKIFTLSSNPDIQ